MKDTILWRSTFYLAYWLLCLDGHVFVLVLILEPLAWLLVKRCPKVEKSLSASPNAPYKRCWSTSGGVWLPIKAPRYFFLLASPSMRRGSRGLAFDCCLSASRTSHCQWLPQPRTPCCFRPRILNLFLALAELCLPAFFSWYPAPAMTRRIHRVSSTS